jgi:hypothetical protein
VKCATDDVLSVLEDIVTAGAQVLYAGYIRSQEVLYASKTLARELVLNASWSSIALDCREILVEPDDDLPLPPIDEWASGVLPVRDSDAAWRSTCNKTIIRYQQHLIFVFQATSLKNSAIMA